MPAKRGVISYPVPPFQNLPIHSEFYIPQVFIISAISLGRQTTVTTTVNHDYEIGQQVRFIIPPPFGTRQLNGLTGFVISIPSPNQAVVDISSQGMDAFIAATYQPENAQIAAIGDVNSGQNNISNKLQISYIPGSFINISPL